MGSGENGASGPATLPFPLAEPLVPFFRVVRIYEKSPLGDRLRIAKVTVVGSTFYRPRTVSSAIHCATASTLSVPS